MADPITEVSDPELWAILMDATDIYTGWATIGGTHYKRFQDSQGKFFFVEQVNRDLLDSRSTSGPSATYTKLDGDT